MDVPFPFLPLLKTGDIWISGGRAICEYACEFANGQDLLGKNFEDKIKCTAIYGICEDLIKKLLHLESKKLRNQEKVRFIEQELCPHLNSFDHLLKDKRWLLDFLSLGDFYLYVILIQVNGIYENTYTNYFWLQKYKINIDLYLSDKMQNTFSPALKGIRTEINNVVKLENSEILIDGKIPIEKSYQNESEFYKDINFIPESLNKSIRMNALIKNLDNFN